MIDASFTEHGRDCLAAAEQLEAKSFPDKNFVGFPKIPRWNREVIVTEKIDGTNAQIVVKDDGQVLAGSRSRYTTPEDDNHGFARWVYENAPALARELGPGQHFGEWWGSGIQRRYGTVSKHFSLFNVTRWSDAPLSLCKVVPVLWTGLMEDLDIASVMQNLKDGGSHASPGFMDPEGIVIFHTASGQLFKKTFEKDAGGKDAAR
jgi:hypothetical protein